MRFLEWLCSLEIPLCVVVGGVFVLVFILLLAPIVCFLYHGWPLRRNDILNNFTGATAAHYLRCFHRSESLEVLANVEGSKAHLQAAQAAGTAAVDAALAAVEAEEDKALEKFKAYYGTQFGRHRFFLPLLLLLALAALGLELIASSVLAWIQTGNTEAGVLPLAVVLALLGGFTWVIYDLISRAAREEISPSDLFWSSFRLVISIPVGYAFGQVFGQTLALPMAYLLGTLPTGTIMTVGGRAAAKWLQLTGAPDQAQTSLQALASVDTFLAERFAAEGLTNVEQLAYTDPVRLSIRTGLSYSVVLCCTGEALLGSYWRKREQLAVAAKYGLSGAYEVSELWERFTGTDPTAQARSDAIINGLAADLQIPRAGVENVLLEVALDPFTQFQRASWAATMQESP